jgi:hypothetical protein
MSGVLGPRLVECGPDAIDIVELEATGESDPRAGRNEELGVRALARRDKIAAVDDGGGQRPMADD